VNGGRDQAYLVSLVREFCALPRETEWVEFKVNDAEPQAVGEYISALANAAALVGKAFAYVIWGVRDSDHSSQVPRRSATKSWRIGCSGCWSQRSIFISTM
jgi:hypothetical protein